jgi:hypothetical protein
VWLRMEASAVASRVVVWCEFRAGFGSVSSFLFAALPC